MSFAKTVVVGNLGGDPELRYMPDGRPIASFSICANERRGSGENRTESPIWFKANIFGKSAEAVAKHLQKGDQVYVEGRLKPELWDGRGGEKRLTLNLNTSDVQFLGKRSRTSQTGEVETTASPGQKQDQEIPF